MDSQRRRRVLTALGMFGGGGVAVTPYYQKVLDLFGEDLIAYLPLSEAAGSSTVLDIAGSFNGGVVAGVTLGEEGIGDGATGLSCSGTAGTINFFSSALSDALAGGNGSLIVWLKKANWNDATLRRAISLHSADSANVLEIRSAGTNSLRCRYKAGTVDKYRDRATTETDWLLIAMSWDVTADELKAWYFDTQISATVTGIGTISSISAAAIGSYGLGGYWDGGLAHAMLLNRAVIQEELTALKTIP